MADEAVVAQKGPYQVELSEGKPYFYCRCGRSQTQPFCDGSHKDTGIEPLRFVGRPYGHLQHLRLQDDRRRAVLRRLPPVAMKEQLAAHRGDRAEWNISSSS